MKDLKDIFEGTLNLDEIAGTKYNVGQMVKFDAAAVQKSNPKVKVSDDSGEIMQKSGKTYTIKMEVNQELVKVKEDQIQSFGDANDSGNQATTGPTEDGQV